MVHSPGRMGLQTKSLFCPEQFVVVSVFGRHLFIVGIVVDFRIRVSPAVRHICDGTGHFGEDQAGRIAGTSDVTPCLATGQETEMQPLLGNDSIQLVCIFRTISFLFRNLKDCPIGRLQETTVFNERRINIASAKTEL